ncbi:MAG: DUF3089 domain-containing protein [Flavisolibacter sp.]|nr:DUF3089 domain-containing protein [Flavisolibacter sp.]
MQRALNVLLVLLMLMNGTPCFADNCSLFSTDTIPDYGNLFYWAGHPWKWDPSDSISQALGNEVRDSSVDVFFIHPTTYTGTRTTWNAPLDDVTLNKKTDYSSILYQASVFNQHARVFAPRYRQLHLSAFFSNSALVQSAFDTAYADVKNAFQYYLQHYHNNRPLIIAGHSQGALMAEWLLKEFFDAKPLQKQLIAAYIIGWPIPQNYFENIRVCNTPEQTGCFCGWRTFRAGYIPEYVKKEATTSYVTNPLTWKTDNNYAGRELNKGSILFNFNRIIKSATDAQIKDGILWVNRPQFPGSIFYRARNYHIGDVNLFYMNVRENVAQRIAAFLQR